MTPIDPDDRRQPYIKVASSIRAAILTGEFEPGQQLPSGHELADFFGVARMTVQQSIRVLREEGFVSTKAGSGVFVRDRPTTDSKDGTPKDHALNGVATFLHEMGFLKILPRTGWFMVGVDQPESVAEHSFRVAIVGGILASMEQADAGRTTMLCLMHDTPETRIGDVPSVGRAYVKTAKAEAVSSHQTAAMPDSISNLIQDLIQEYEAGITIEAKIAHDADKIETLLQAREYQAQGQYKTEPWQVSSTATLNTKAAKDLAAAITGADPQEWWKAFASSYKELRTKSRGAAPSP